MSRIAGVFYFDFRPVSEAGESHLRRLRHPSEDLPVQFARVPGALLAQSPSRFEAVENRECAVLADGSVCLWDGRLDNRDSLSLRFSREQGRPGISSALAALRHYRAAGASGLRALIGDWSLAIWDASSKSIVLASDYAGIRPLYYHHGRDRLYWSSSLAGLAEWTGADAIDEEFAARFLISRTVPRRTPYPGIYPVPPGHSVRVSAEGLSIEPFWQPPVHQELRLADDQDYEEGLRTLFREAVEVRVRGGSPVCAELSGGLDSSSVVCMGDRVLAPSARPIPISYLHPGCADEPYIRAVESACHLQGIRLGLEDYPLVSAERTGGAAPGWWEPKFVEVARRMESFGAGVLLTGQTGDFIMGNLGDDSEQVADYLEQRRLRAALREAFAWSHSLQIPVYSVLWRSLRTTWLAWTAPAISDAFSGPKGRFTAVDSLTPRMRALNSTSTPHSAHEEWRHAPPSRRRRFSMLTQMVEGRGLQTPEPLQHLSWTHPFAHRPLVEFMLTIPPGQVCRPDEPRRLMRRAFAQLLPEPVVNRKSKAHYTQSFRQALLPLAAVLLADPGQIRTVELGYVERDSLLERLRRFSQGLECNETQLRQILLFEFWIRGWEARSSSGATQPFAGTTTSTVVPSPGELHTENVAPI